MQGCNDVFVFSLFSKIPCQSVLICVTYFQIRQVVKLMIVGNQKEGLFNDVYGKKFYQALHYSIIMNNIELREFRLAYSLWSCSLH